MNVKLLVSNKNDAPASAYQINPSATYTLVDVEMTPQNRILYHLLETVGAATTGSLIRVSSLTHNITGASIPMG